MDTTNLAPPRQSIAIAVPVAMLFMAAIAVGLRFYTRYAILRNVCVDDWAVALAYVSRPRDPPFLVYFAFAHHLNTVSDPYFCMRDCDSVE